jgi:hypothetical protein
MSDSLTESVEAKSYRVNEPDVSAEDFRSEILAVDLKKGHYHSLRGAAVPIWRLLTSGAKVESIIGWLAPIYGRTSSEMALTIVPFVAQLEESKLIVPEGSVPASGDAARPDWLEELAPTFEPPVLETYTEMEDLLMLDPIHDVDAAGWPHPSEAKAERP